MSLSEKTMEMWTNFRFEYEDKRLAWIKNQKCNEVGLAPCRAWIEEQLRQTTILRQVLTADGSTVRVAPHWDDLPAPPLIKKTLRGCAAKEQMSQRWDLLMSRRSDIKRRDDKTQENINASNAAGRRL
jgi:hypothetical protein